MKCPCCGSEITEFPMRELGEANLTVLEWRLVQALSDAFPRRLTIDSLIGAMWWGAREPEQAWTNLRTHIRRTRAKLRPLGWTIKAAGESTYRLEKLDEPTQEH